jgi:hypothetical protein
MWHRTPLPDFLIAEAALHHNLGVVHVEGDFNRIAEVRSMTARRLRTREQERSYMPGRTLYPLEPDTCGAATYLRTSESGTASVSDDEGTVMETGEP